MLAGIAAGRRGGPSGVSVDPEVAATVAAAIDAVVAAAAKPEAANAADAMTGAQDPDPADDGAAAALEKSESEAAADAGVAGVSATVRGRRRGQIWKFGQCCTPHVACAMYTFHMVHTHASLGRAARTSLTVFLLQQVADEVDLVSRPVSAPVSSSTATPLGSSYADLAAAEDLGVLEADEAETAADDGEQPLVAQTLGREVRHGLGTLVQLRGSVVDEFWPDDGW